MRKTLSFAAVLAAACSATIPVAPLRCPSAPGAVTDAGAPADASATAGAAPVPDAGTAEIETAAKAEDDRFAAGHIGQTVYVEVECYSPKDGGCHRTGTGTIVGKDGTVITAYHVVIDQEYVTAWTLRWRETPDADGDRYERVREVPMTVVRVSKKKDVALLRPKHGDALPEPMPIAHRVPAEGTKVRHLGETSVVAHGTVYNAHTVSLAPGFEVEGVIEAAIPTKFGDSGGPLVTEDGAIVGICLSLDDTKGHANFLPIDTAFDALRIKASK